MKNHWFSVAVLLALGALASIPPTRADITNGLVAYYPFNGNANDASTNGNNGTVVGATFQTDGTSGKTALQFAGNGSSYVVVPRSASLEPPDGLSISMWCNGVPGEACGFGWGTILRKADGCSAGYFIRGCNSGTAFQLDGANPCSGGWAAQALFQTFTGTTWQHIVGTYSVTDGMVKTYENGVLINQAPLSNQLVHSGDLYIGGAAVAGDDGGFNGLINEVRIYNRALSETDVAELYGNSPGCTGCTGPQGPAGATGPQGPEGVGLVQGAIIALVSGSPAPSGFTLLGTSTMSYHVGKKALSLNVDLYKKN